MEKIYLPNEIIRRLKNLAKLDREVCGHIVFAKEDPEDIPVGYAITGIGESDTVGDDRDLLKGLKRTLPPRIPYEIIPFHTHSLGTLGGNPDSYYGKNFSARDLEALARNAYEDPYGVAFAFLATPKGVFAKAYVAKYENEINLNVIGEYAKPPLREFGWTFGVETDGTTPYEEALIRAIENRKIPKHYVDVYIGRPVQANYKRARKSIFQKLKELL